MFFDMSNRSFSYTSDVSTRDQDEKINPWGQEREDKFVATFKVPLREFIPHLCCSKSLFHTRKPLTITVLDEEKKEKK